MRVFLAGPSRIVPVVGAALLAAAASLLLTLAACSAPLPEARIRALMQQAEAAAEDRDVDALMATVSDAYRDPEGRDKAALRGVVAFYLRQHGNVHILYRERELRLGGPDDAEVRAAVALAGQPLGSGIDLSRIEADLLLVFVTLRREHGDWKVVSADWEPAALADFLGD